jgi:DNA excision repair protein ERCC-4
MSKSVTEPPTIIVDSREQLPWSFTLPTVVRGLPAGDYSIVGHESDIALERKSLDDFVGSITFGRERFWRELEKLAALRCKAVVVEASIGDVLACRYQSKAHSWSVVASALAITADFGIAVLWMHNAACAARCGEWMLKRFVEKQAVAKEGT